MTNERRDQFQQAFLEAVKPVLVRFFGLPATDENVQNMKLAIRADLCAITALNEALVEYPELGDEEVTSEDTGVIRWVGAVGMRAGV